MKSCEVEKYGDDCCCFSLPLYLSPDAAPTRSTPSFPPPVLSVQPSTGVVNHGDTLSFRCSVPSLLSQPQNQSSYNNKPVTFLLLRAAEGTGVTSIILQPLASQGSQLESQPGVFSVGPVRGGEEGEYTCLYQIIKKRGIINSTVSNKVQITVKGEKVLLQHPSSNLPCYPFLKNKSYKSVYTCILTLGFLFH